MELNYLIYFRTVAKTEHISQAAAELHITQPALSRAISRVEQEVGAQLFERGANSIRLNHAGRAFLRRGNRFFRNMTMPCGRPRTTAMWKPAA